MLINQKVGLRKTNWTEPTWSQFHQKHWLQALFKHTVDPFWLTAIEQKVGISLKQPKPVPEKKYLLVKCYPRNVDVFEKAGQMQRSLSGRVCDTGRGAAIEQESNDLFVAVTSSSMNSNIKIKYLITVTKPEIM